MASGKFAMLMESAIAMAVVMAMVAGPRPASGEAAHPRKKLAATHGWPQHFMERSDSHFIHHEEPGALFTLETHRQGFPSGIRGVDKPFFTGSFAEHFRGPPPPRPPPHPRPFSAPARPPHPQPLPGPHSPHDAKRGPQVLPKPPRPPKPQEAPSKDKQVYANEGPGGCHTNEGFYFAGQTWYVKGCRRRTCIHFRGTFITETDSCDSEIFNTTYKCIVQVDTNAQYPDCCPTYRCNPDNLGNSVK